MSAMTTETTSVDLKTARSTSPKPSNRKVNSPVMTTLTTFNSKSPYRRTTVPAAIAPDGRSAQKVVTVVIGDVSRVNSTLSKVSTNPQKVGTEVDIGRQRRSDQLVARLKAGQMRPKYSRCRGGKRADLDGRYFRSSWEANYARYLNWLKKSGKVASWEFEPKTFIFEAIQRGTRAYTPDFRVVLPDGQVEWHEVKGWMDDKSKTRLARMAKYYPEEKIVLRDSKFFRWLNGSVLPKVIPNWETGREVRP